MLHKSVLLTPSNSEQDGASIKIPSDTETIPTSAFWNITTNRQDSWHLLLKLDNSWGFHPLFTSIVKVEIESPTIASESTFDDLLIAVTTPNMNKYVAMRIYMDNPLSIDNLITPSCNTSNGLQSGNVSILPNTKRICDVMVDCQGPNYQTMLPPQQDNGQPNGFPVTFTFENRPNQRLNIQYKSDAFRTKSFTQDCHFFKNSFETNTGFEMYVGIGQFPMNQTCSIKSFHVEYYYNETEAPTMNPTLSPTDETIVVENPTVSTMKPDGIVHETTAIDNATVTEAEKNIDGDNVNKSESESLILYIVIGVLCGIILVIVVIYVIGKRKKFNKKLRNRIESKENNKNEMKLGHPVVNDTNDDGDIIGLVDLKRDQMEMGLGRSTPIGEMDEKIKQKSTDVEDMYQKQKTTVGDLEEGELKQDIDTNDIQSVALVDDTKGK